MNLFDDDEHPPTMPESYRLARTTDPQTSKEAASAVVESLPRMHAWATECVYLSPGKTSRELAKMYCPTDPREINRRLPECEEMGMIKRGKVRVCQASKKRRRAVTWWPIDSVHPDSVGHPKKKKRDRVAEAVQKEREACAALCEAKRPVVLIDASPAEAWTARGQSDAKMIRERGKPMTAAKCEQCGHDLPADEQKEVVCEECYSPPRNELADIIENIERCLPRWRIWFPSENSEVEIPRRELLILVEAAKESMRK